MGKKRIPNIALLTDFGLKEQYVAAMKGAILTVNPSVNIIDITHEIHPHHIHQASYVLWTVYNYFPKNTIFVGVVDPGVGGQRRVIIVKTKKYFFIAPDNGLLDIVLFQEKTFEAVELSLSSLGEAIPGNISSTFHGRDIIAPAAALLSNNGLIQNFGSKISMPEIFTPFVSSRTDTVPASIMNIDRFGSIITNIRPLEIEKSMKDIQAVSVGSNMVTQWIQFYDEAPENTPCLIVGSSGLVEISVKRNDAARLLSATIDSKLKIYWR
ncbi:MAG: SAM-dependent chlorinase/fluorinase [Bacteroidetes bacterium]|nr:SAM-dependent chlorinase/fluorinase [Bacteroidota bacterium]